VKGGPISQKLRKTNGVKREHISKEEFRKGGVLSKRGLEKKSKEMNNRTIWYTLS